MRLPADVLAAPVLLIGMPRSGTTWLSQIVESAPEFLVRLSPNYSYPLKNLLTEDSTAAEWVDVLGRAAESDDPFLTQDWRRTSGELPWFDGDPARVVRLAIKDTRFHAVYQQGMRVLPGALAVHIVRSPVAGLRSWYRSEEFHPEDGTFEEQWRDGGGRKREGWGEYWGFDDWMTVTESWLRLGEELPGRVLTVAYEDLRADPVTVARRIFGFAGLDLPEETVRFITDSRSRHDGRTYSVFKDPTVREDPAAGLPAPVVDEISREVRGTRLEGFLR